MTSSFKCQIRQILDPAVSVVTLYFGSGPVATGYYHRVLIRDGTCIPINFVIKAT